MKKVLSIVLSIAMVLCMMPAMAFAGTDAVAYSDIEGTACEASVELLSELGVVNGYSDGTYKPEKEVTRAEMAKLIVVALGLDPQAGTSSFIDMGTAEWAIPYVGYAQSLGIINGYGGGKFGPNDQVTYDQAITMIVRALGYTTACNEMQGTWPAVFVQKANELGILKDVNKFGSNPSNRGDIAIMLANALNVEMVYADNEGSTQYKTDGSGSRVTMYSSLVKDAHSVYSTVDANDVASAKVNIASYLGAAGKVVSDEDNKVISVSDIKTVYLTGKFKSSPSAIFTGKKDDVEYSLSQNVTKVLNSDGKGVDTSSIDVYKNGAYSSTLTSADLTTSMAAVSSAGIYNTDITLSCTVDGKRITGIYAILKWTADDKRQVEESDVAKIASDNELNGYEFYEDKDGNIDTKRFILDGVDSLDKIAEDNIVYTYADGKYITKLEVGTEQVTGGITRYSVTNSTVTDRYVVVNGTKYNFASGNTIDLADIATGNEITLYLDSKGKVFTEELVDGTTGNYAVVITADSYSNSALKGVKMQLLTPDGVKIFTVNTDKFASDGSDYIGTTGTAIKYSVDADGKIKSTKVASPAAIQLPQMKVTNNGFFNSLKIADSAVIYSMATSSGGLSVNNGAAVSTGAIYSTDTDEYTVLKKADILGCDIQNAYYVTNDKNEIAFMVIADGTLSKDVFGVIEGTFKDKDDDVWASYIAGTEASAEAEVGTGSSAEVATPAGILFKINKNSDGSVKFTSAETSGAAVTTAAVSASAIKVSGSKVTYTTDGSSFTTKYLSDNCVVYIYDTDNKEYKIGSKADIYSSKNVAMKFYITEDDSDKDDYGLITYVMISR